MKKFVKQNKQRLLNALVFMFAFMLIPMALESTFLRLMPATYWFEYDRVETLHETIIAGEQPRFISYAEFKRPIRMEWIDVLRCKDEHGWYFYRSYESDDFISEPTTFPRIEIDPKTDETITASWSYPYPLPEPNTECELTSNIKGILKFGIVKTQIVKSTFTVRPRLQEEHDNVLK